MSPSVRHTLLTGPPGVGKTTVIRSVIALGLPIAGGFYTSEIRTAGQRQGFAVKALGAGGSETAMGVLAHVNIRGPLRVSKYGVDVECFDRVGVTALRAARQRQGWIVIDEIGSMELYSWAFQVELLRCLDAANPVLGVIKNAAHPFLDSIRARPDVRIVEVTRANRDRLPTLLFSELVRHNTGERRDA